VADEQSIAQDAAAAIEEAQELGDRAKPALTSFRYVKPKSFKGNNSMSIQENEQLLRGWLLRHTPAASPASDRLLSQRGITGDSLEIRSGLLSSTTPGSYTREESTLLSDFEVLLSEFSDFFKFGRKIATASGEKLRIACDSDKAKGGIVAEGSVETPGDYSVGTKEIGCDYYSSGIVLLSYEILKDSAFVQRMVSEGLARRLTRTTSDLWVNGDGTAGAPMGLLAHVDNATASFSKIDSITSATAGAITLPDLVKLYGALPAASQSDPSTKVWMSPSCYSSYLSLVDGSNRPFATSFDSGPSAAPYGTFFGHEIRVLPELPAMATGKISCVMGPADQFLIRSVGNFELQIAREFWFTSRQIGLRILWRGSMGILDGSRFKALKLK
jgi:HK97 family phage major capsid protein